MYDLFSLPSFSFPKGFLWGSATAGHQIEGNNTNAQLYHKEIRENYAEKSGLACNHYRLFREDAALIARLGHQAYRCSVEWSRIEPEPGHWSEKALDHYREFLELLKKSGITTFVTLYHWTTPQWFEELGGFEKRENLHYFLRFAEKIVKSLDDVIDFYLVLNEKTHTCNGAASGFAFIRAHAVTYRLLKTLTGKPVSSAHMALHCFPNRCYDELDRIMTNFLDFKVNGVFLHALKTGTLIAPETDEEACPEAKGALDFWALNMYTRYLVNSRAANLSAERFPHKKLRLIGKDFYLDEFYPEGATAILERFTGYPVYITENGCACDDDRFRIVYIALYLSAIHDAIRRGADIRGYLYWSLLDNYEWTSFLPRFGLVEVDFRTFKRTVRPCAEFFRDIIAANGFSQDILRKYLREMPSCNAPQRGAAGK